MKDDWFCVSITKKSVALPWYSNDISLFYELALLYTYNKAIMAVVVRPDFIHTAHINEIATF